MNRFIEEEEDDEEELDWKDSYSDLMTDLLAVFVLLLSFALINQSAVNRKAVADQQSIIDIAPKISILSDQESILPETNSLNEGILPEKNSLIAKEDDFNKLYESMRDYIEEENLSDKLNVTKQGKDKILLRVEATVFFDSGSANINTSSEPILDKISELFLLYEESIRIVRIEGHTDNRPIKNSKFESNWELSVSRAVNVLKKIVEKSGIKPEKFSAVGYSEFYPIASNDTASGRAKNRRVDFIIESVD